MPTDSDGRVPGQEGREVVAHREARPLRPAPAAGKCGQAAQLRAEDFHRQEGAALLSRALLARLKMSASSSSGERRIRGSRHHADEERHTPAQVGQHRRHRPCKEGGSRAWAGGTCRRAPRGPATSSPNSTAPTPIRAEPKPCRTSARAGVPWANPEVRRSKTTGWSPAAHGPGHSGGHPPRPAADGAREVVGAGDARLGQ
jgi:hypothetical protein